MPSTTQFPRSSSRWLIVIDNCIESKEFPIAADALAAFGDTPDAPMHFNYLAIAGVMQAVYSLSDYNKGPLAKPESGWMVGDDGVCEPVKVLQLRQGICKAWLVTLAGLKGQVDALILERLHVTGASVMAQADAALDLIGNECVKAKVDSARAKYDHVVTHRGGVGDGTFWFETGAGL